MPQIWKKEELEILTNSPNKNTIKIEGRSKRSIHRKLLSLGLIEKAYEVRVHKKSFWTQKEIDLLKSSKDPKNVKIPGRTRDSVVRMSAMLKLFKKQKPRRPWKKKNEKILMDLVKKGMTPAQIFKMNVIPHSKTSIQKKMCALGFSKKAPKSKRFSYIELKKFKQFLQDNWQGKTPQEITDLWNEKNPFQKISYKKVLYHLVSLNIKISYKEVIRIKNLRKKEEEIKKSNNNPVRLIDSIKKARMEFMMNRLSENKDLWTGMQLTENELLIGEGE
jgi:hypothetical protein